MIGNVYTFALICGFLALVAFASAYALGMKAVNKELERKQGILDNKMSEARKEADDIIKNALKEAKEIAIRQSKEFENEQKEKNNELQKIEKRIQKREEQQEKRIQELDKKEKDLKKKSEQIEKEEKRQSDILKESEKILVESQQKLESVANMTVEEARQELRQTIETEVRKNMSSEIKIIEDDARRQAEDKSRAIVATAIQRLANEFVTDACVSVVSLPTDDMKGRIIGREGRNIRAIEQATGVDLIIDDTPEAVIISCFNPERREIARVAIERLVADGRIHPARIDEVVDKVRGEFASMVREAGERSAFECGITGLHPELIEALGRLKFRTTGGQSVLQHSIETAQIAGLIASELEMDARMARRAGLLHDIGKALSEESEGNHSAVGAQLAQKCGEKGEIIEAIQRHHHDNLQGVSPITVIVQAANALSGYRPGARKEFLEKSIGRMRDMETLVKHFGGVADAFVIRSGREVRALVTPEVLDDESVTLMARGLAKKIRSEMSHPGQVKVTMVRESRVTHIAR